MKKEALANEMFKDITREITKHHPADAMVVGAALVALATAMVAMTSALGNNEEATELITMAINKALKAEQLTKKKGK